MSTDEHYLEEALIALTGGDGAMAPPDAHLENCAACSDQLSGYHEMIAALREPVVWQQPVSSAPQAETLRLLRAASDRMRGEDADAEILVSGLLKAPAGSWPGAASEAKYQTGGVVRKLVSLVYPAADRSPSDAVAMARLALEIAVGRGEARLRGDAAHALAYALTIAGELRGAMEAIDAAEAAFQQLAVSEFDLARLRVTRSMILSALDRFGDALAEVRASSSAFQRFGDERRRLTVLSSEAVVRYRAGDIRGALETFLSVEQKMEDDHPERAGLLQNIAACYGELADFDLALDWHRRACQALQEAGASANLLRARWTLARLLVSQQRWDEAAVVLRAVIFEFAQTGMRDELVLTRLDLAEVLLGRGEHDEAAAICHGLVEELRASELGQTRRSLLAVSYLHEAVRSRRATPALLTHVRDYLERVRTEPALLFAPPPL